MKIAIIGTRGYPYVYSGYETFAQGLAERLVENGIFVTIYCHKNLFMEKPKEVNGIKLKYFNSIKSKAFSQLSHSIQATIHACFQKYDVILYVNPANGPLGILTTLFRKKTAINVDGLEWLRPKWRGLGAKYFYWASKMSTKWFDKVVTDSFEMEKIYKSEFKTESEVIAYGANIRYSKEPERINKWKLQKDQYYLVVGRLIPDNNSDLIVSEFIKTQSTKKLVIVGDVPYVDEYASNIKSKKDERLVFTGYVNDQTELAELYHNCFVYIHGHQYGGTNPTMLKALAYGCAILALDTVFNFEMLVDGEYGSFFSKEESSLASHIVKFESEPDKLALLREKSRDRIESNYTWEKITNQYINLFERLTSKQ